MFLLPALVTAVASEIAYAAVATEKHTSKTETTEPYRASRRPTLINAVVDPVGYASEESPLPMSDKQVVVFGTNNHPGINTAVVGASGNYEGWTNVVSQRSVDTVHGDIRQFPLAWQACEYTVKAALPGFTPTFVVELGTNLCFNAAKALYSKGLALTETNIVETVKKLWNGMPKKQQNKITKPQAVKAAKKVAKSIMAPNGLTKAGAAMMRVSAPAAASAVIGRNGNPRTKSTARGITVTHSEMVGTLVSSSTSGGYFARNFVVNPAKSDIFPWLSGIATNYDKYRVRRCCVHLVSMQPTSRPGRMGVAYDPDSTDALPVDRSEVYAMFRHVEGPMWQSTALELPVSGKELYCNTHTTADSKLIDDGQVIVFSDAADAASLLLADIIVEYTVELLDPQQAIFCTSYNTLGGISATSGSGFAPLTVQGPSYAKFYTSSNNTFYCVPSPGYYNVQAVFYDAGAGTPGMLVHNGTANDLVGTNIKITTHAVASFFCKIGQNSTTANSFTGEYLSFKVTTIADLASLESIRITITRVAPPIFTQVDASNLGMVVAAPAADWNSS